MYKPIRSADLVSGGNIIKQGEHFTLTFQLFDVAGQMVDVTGKTITVKIANTNGVVLESIATAGTEGKISFDVNEDIGHGEMRVEIKVSDGATVIQKYPADGWLDLRITQSLDDLGIGGINAVTVTQLRSEIAVVQKQLDAVVARETDSDAMSRQAAFNSEGVDKGNLKVRLDEDYNFITSQYATKLEVQTLDDEVTSHLADISVNVKLYGAKGDGVTDDTLAIQNAINSLSSSYGGTILIPTGIYQISQTLSIENSNIVLVGTGSGGDHNAGIFSGGDGATILRWSGASAGTMVKISAVSGSQNPRINSCGLSKIYLEGMNVAGIGLQILSHRFGNFSDLLILNFTRRGLDLSCIQDLAEAGDTQRNNFTNITIRGIGEDSIYLDGNSNGNTSFNTFISIAVSFGGTSNAFVLANTDNNFFFNCGAFREGSGTGLGLEFLGSNDISVGMSRSNTFYGFSTNGGVIAKGGTYSASYNNSIMLYDTDNNSPNPIIESGATLFLQKQNNTFFSPAFVNSAIGNNEASALAARGLSNSTSSLIVHNNSQNHTVLTDGTNSWTIRIGGGGELEIFATAGGGGGLSLPALLKYAGFAVSSGANDSAGTGYRALRIPN